MNSSLAPAGLGRDIADAYADFNNPRMYALMLLLLIVATVVNTRAARTRHALGAAARDRRDMTATRRAADTLAIVVVMLLVVAGAAPGRRRYRPAGPVPTLAYLAALRADAAVLPTTPRRRLLPSLWR